MSITIILVCSELFCILFESTWKRERGEKNEKRMHKRDKM